VTHASAWARLGIERTDDLTAIRKAYAKRLKETDVEADPRAFISLREARDHAMDFARAPTGEPEAGDRNSGFGSWEDEATAFVERSGQWTVQAGPAPAPEAPADRGAEARQARFAELQSLLFADHDEPEDPPRMRGLLRDILADPEMHGLDHAERMEHWLAWAAASAGPRADPVVTALVEHFRWEENVDAWDQSYEVVALVERHRGLLFREVALPSASPYHTAWLELTGTEPKLGWDRYLAAGRVAKLLTIIRDHCPAAEDLLNPYRVALWDEHLEGSVKRYMIVALFVFAAAFLAVRLLSHGA